MSHWTDHLDPSRPPGAYLSWKQVGPRVGISRTTAWRLQKAGEFPRPYVISAGRVAYREGEVEAWKASRAHREEGGRRAPRRRRSPRPARPARSPRSRPAAPRPPGRPRIAPAGGGRRVPSRSGCRSRPARGWAPPRGRC